MFKHLKKLKNQSVELKQSGNAMVYVLIALALFGFLTITLSSQNDQADGQDLDDEQAILYANELMSYVASAQNAVDMMLATGSEIDDLDFVLPSEAAFNTPPHYNKVFHPQGGGLNYEEFKEEISNGTGANKFFIKNTTNVEWTPTSSSDVLLSTIQMNETICRQYNKYITGSNDIPEVTNTLDTWLVDTSTTDFNISDCSECDGYHTLCIKRAGGVSHGIYYVIAAQ